MNALALSPLLGYAVIAVTALLIILLHLLRPRALRRAVSSTVLWAEVLRQRSRYHAPWRWLLSLLLCLLVGLALALALGRPDGLGGDQLKVVVVLDNSPSMAARTRDGSSRWQSAVAKARSIIGASGVDVMLVDTMGHAPVEGFVRPARALETLARFEASSHGVARSPVLPEAGEFDLHVITDGVAGFDVPDGAIVHSVFEQAVNVAITGLQVRPFPADPLRVEAFVQVYNASTQGQRVRLSLRGAKQFSVAQELQMGAGELIDASFDISDFEAGVLAAAALAEGDAFAQDDIAFALVAPHRVRDVVLVTQGNDRLQDAIRSLPGVRLRVMAPAAWHNEVRADAFVFDRFAPEQPPARGALLFRPGDTSWLPGERRNVNDPVISSWQRGNAVLDGVAWQKLRTGRAFLLDGLPDDASSLVSTANGALIAAGTAGSRWIIAGFSPEDSNLSLQPGLPVFLGNALRWLVDSDPAISTGLGNVHVPLPQARVLDGAGELVRTHAFGNTTLFDATRPDVYTAVAEDAKVRIVANVLDPRDADINVSRFDSGQSGSGRVTNMARTEPWILLVVFAMIVMLIEWLAWARRFSR
jgi:hypothetical protein